MTVPLGVPLAEIDPAAAKDKLTGKARADFCLAVKLSDPMIRLFMQADAVSEADVRGACAWQGRRHVGGDDPRRAPAPGSTFLSQDAMSPRWGSSRPGIGG